MNKDTYDLKDVLSKDAAYKVLIFMMLCIKLAYVGLLIAYVSYAEHVAETNNVWKHV